MKSINKELSLIIRSLSVNSVSQTRPNFYR